MGEVWSPAPITGLVSYAPLPVHQVKAVTAPPLSPILYQVKAVTGHRKFRAEVRSFIDDMVSEGGKQARGEPRRLLIYSS